MLKKPKKPFVLRAAVINAIRRIFRRWPAYQEIIADQKIEFFVPSKHGKKMRRVGFYCRKCKNLTAASGCQVDHIDPVIDPKVGFVDFNTYIERMFCAKSNLQILCKKCHKLKSKDENKVRRAQMPSRVKAVKKLLKRSIDE